MPKKTTKSVKKQVSKPTKKAIKKGTNEESVSKKTGRKTPQSVRGFRDILPNERSAWAFVEKTCRSAAEAYGFQYVDMPVVEPTPLFERGIGRATDIVEKEMFTFEDKGGDSLTLRPEMTAGMARAYIEHGMVNQPQPIKWYGLGPVYRYQRPQYGSQREFHQWSCEAFGEDHPVMDAQIMIMVANVFEELGLPVTLQVNTIGDEECRPVYRKALLDYYRPHRKDLCEDCIARIGKNPLRLLDCKEEKCSELKSEAPQFVDHLCDACQKHFEKIIEYLDELDVPYVLNPHVVRGLDYYTRTVFEVWASDDERGRTALGGGGRYDGLLEQLGARPTPAVGLALGLERIIIKLKEQGIKIPPVRRPDVYIAQLGEPAKRKAMRLFEDLRRSGVQVSANFAKDGLKQQMEIAAKLSVRYTLIIGQKEMVDSTIIIRDMEAGMQEVYDFRRALPEIEKKLQTNRLIEPEEVEEEPIVESED
jgi:histidyl-tRNA synthetase